MNVSLELLFSTLLRSCSLNYFILCPYSEHGNLKTQNHTIKWLENWMSENSTG